MIDCRSGGFPGVDAEPNAEPGRADHGRDRDLLGERVGVGAAIAVQPGFPASAVRRLGHRVVDHPGGGGLRRGVGLVLDAGNAQPLRRNRGGRVRPERPPVRKRGSPPNGERHGARDRPARRRDGRSPPYAHRQPRCRHRPCLLPEGRPPRQRQPRWHDQDVAAHWKMTCPLTNSHNGLGLRQDIGT